MENDILSCFEFDCLFTPFCDECDDKCLRFRNCDDCVNIDDCDCETCMHFDGICYKHRKKGKKY